MKIKAIIFDFDGVLVESFDIKTKAFAELYDFAGPPLAQDGVRYHVQNGGVSRQKKIEHFYFEILKRPLSNERFEELCNRYARLVVEQVLKAPYVPGAKEFLDSYAGIVKFYVVSGVPQEEISYIVQKRGLSKYFECVRGSPQEKSIHVQEILSASGLRPHEVVFVGDALSDFYAAEKNDLNFIARIHADNESIFKDKICKKIADLTSLKDAIQDFQ